MPETTRRPRGARRPRRIFTRGQKVVVSRFATTRSNCRSPVRTSTPPWKSRMRPEVRLPASPPALARDPPDRDPVPPAREAERFEGVPVSGEPRHDLRHGRSGTKARPDADPVRLLGRVLGDAHAR